MQAVRGDLPGAGHHHRGRAPRGRQPPHHALRHRYDQVHLLRVLPGILPGGRHRRRPQFRVRHRDPRGALLRQGEAARERRPLGTGDRQEPRARRALPMSASVIVQAICFYAFSAVLIASGVMVVASRNPVHSVLFLILAFFNAAALFLLLGAEFLALILVIVYVGAVAVLFLFVVMMLDINFVELRQGFLQYLPIGALIGIILLVELLLVFAGWVVAPSAGQLAQVAASAGGPVSNTHALGAVLYTKYLYLFETAGMILLVAMVGAIVLTLRERVGVRRQSISSQLARRGADSIEIKKIPSRSGV